MNNQILIIYDHDHLFDILEEIKNEINFRIINISKVNLSTLQLNDTNNYLFITSKKIPKIDNQYVLDNAPIKLSKLIENFNIEFLKKRFKEQTKVVIGNYKVNLNTRELIYKQKNLKLTEKETNMIIYLSQFDKAVKIDELKTNVWGHQSELDTHTVETHIYRLRKKILTIFNDKNFIITDDNGYYISRKIN